MTGGDGHLGPFNDILDVVCRGSVNESFLCHVNPFPLILGRLTSVGSSGYKEFQTGVSGRNLVDLTSNFHVSGPEGVLHSLILTPHRSEFEQLGEWTNKNTCDPKSLVYVS